jgi:cytochrome c oxidase subunit 2
MSVAAAVIIALVLAAAWAALYGPRELRSRLKSSTIIVGAGIVFPTDTMAAMLIYGFTHLYAGAASANDPPALTIPVVGKQWWWRVIYETPEGQRVESANEIRLPVDRNVRFVLSSDDVIHSFWIPAFGGKLDMIPGRENVMHVRVREPGETRGQCAEYCGGAHAFMAFRALAMPVADFARWLDAEAGPAVNLQHPGHSTFLQAGCGACHAVRGTGAVGQAGPDLTHLGARRSLGADVMEMSAGNIADWIGRHQEIKPDNLMPPFDYLSDAERAEIGAWLASLE